MQDAAEEASAAVESPHIFYSLPLARMQVFCFGNNGVPIPYTQAGLPQTRTLNRPGTKLNTQTVGWVSGHPTPIRQPAGRGPRSSTIPCMVVSQQPAVPRRMPHSAQRDIRHRARSATLQIAPPPPACRAPQGSGWSAACRGTGWPRHPMGCSNESRAQTQWAIVG